ncbi:MAG: preprotein translocase subunit SecG [Oscillospiraceae bacterium]|nr:preprotein translocase subunit SecG [Oscillospiraceae bacterium]
MTVYEIIGSILLIITCVLVTITVLFQSSSKQDGLSALGGKSSAASAAEAKSNNAKLARITKVLAVVFFVVTLAVYALTIYL